MSPVVPTANLARGIVSTDLAYDVSARSARATITFAPGPDAGATLEVGDLVIKSIESAGGEAIAFRKNEAARTLDLALAASSQPTKVVVTFTYAERTKLEGATASATYTWPYFCGNLFPCHSNPADGLTFGSITLSGVPAGKTAVYPTSLAEAPSYQFAWAIDTFTEEKLGTTEAGTQLSVWGRPEDFVLNASGRSALTAHANLVAAFNFMEKTYGPYAYGNKAGTVIVDWPAGVGGGMEHHPYWHEARANYLSALTPIHEAAHGWFGNGVRGQCWEDFVLSEGTVSYIAGRASEVVAPAFGAAVWNSYATSISSMDPTLQVWPMQCGTVDVAKDLFTNAPYHRGALFYRAVALKVGPEKLDEALKAFYGANRGKAATMTAMLDTIRTTTGFDPTLCAQKWLRDKSVIPAANQACD